MKLREETVSKNYIYQGKILSLRCDDARLPNGKPCKREIVEHAGGAAVLCIKDGCVALVKQFRYAYGAELWELPAGKLEPGEDPETTAMRELKEETGLVAGRLEHMLTLYPSPGYTNEKIYVYEALYVRDGEQSLDEGEFLHLSFVPVEEALSMA